MSYWILDPRACQGARMLQLLKEHLPDDWHGGGHSLDGT